VRIVIWVNAFAGTQRARRVVQIVRQIPGVVRGEGTQWTLDAVATVDGDYCGSMDAVVDGISEEPVVLRTDSRAAGGEK
jgi:hypothetical protein